MTNSNSTDWITITAIKSMCDICEHLRIGLLKAGFSNEEVFILIESIIMKTLFPDKD